MKMLVVVLSSFLFTFVSLFEERLFFLILPHQPHQALCRQGPCICIHLRHPLWEESESESLSKACPVLCRLQGVVLYQLWKHHLGRELMLASWFYQLAVGLIQGLLAALELHG